LGEGERRTLVGVEASQQLVGDDGTGRVSGGCWLMTPAAETVAPALLSTQVVDAGPPRDGHDPRLEVTDRQAGGKAGPRAQEGRLRGVVGQRRADEAARESPHISERGFNDLIGGVAIPSGRRVGQLREIHDS
jgi:hypothetical protein